MIINQSIGILLRQNFRNYPQEPTGAVKYRSAVLLVFFLNRLTDRIFGFIMSIYSMSLESMNAKFETPATERTNQETTN
jgi:hypothetical protein